MFVHECPLRLAGNKGDSQSAPRRISFFQGGRQVGTRTPSALAALHQPFTLPMTNTAAPRLDRRESIQRIAWILGGVLSAELSAGLLGQVLHVGERVKVSPETAQLLAEIADVIIPTTDTPGAKAAGAEQFVIRVMRDCYGYVEQEEFYRELAKLQDETQKRFSKPFNQLETGQKIEMVKHAAVHLKGFFLRMRALTVAGYFSSEIGATKALEYVPIPGRFEGAIPMKPGQRAWAI